MSTRKRAPQFGGDGFERHRARKRFSQNFLVDEAVIDRIVSSIGLAADDRVVEIGPGRGALTERLQARVRELVAIEIDRDLIHGLSIRWPDLRIIDQDVLKVDLAGLFDDGRPYRVVGNLPYNISTPLIFRLLEHPQAFSDAHFMLQDEVVQRLSASPGDRDWGRLGVMVQYHCAVERLFAVGADAFVPQPRVRSRIVRLIPHPTPPHSARDPQRFAEVVRAAFAQRRKTLRNTLKQVPGMTVDVVADLEALGIDFSARPETLDIATFVAIADRLTDA